MELSYTKPDAPDNYLYSMSPSAIKALLLKVVRKTDDSKNPRYCQPLFWSQQTNSLPKVSNKDKDILTMIDKVEGKKERVHYENVGASSQLLKNMFSVKNIGA